jgi:hypothetical protein
MLIFSVLKTSFKKNKYMVLTMFTKVNSYTFIKAYITIIPVMNQNLF